MELLSVNNGEFECAVAPATGRIVRYGPAGGRNALWENGLAGSTPSPFEGWLNWGGDKVWIWPEGDWATWQAGHVAPPGDPPSCPYEVEVDSLALRMTSPVVPAYGLRIIRDISLAKKGSKVTLVSRLEKVADVLPPGGGPPLPVGVWVVTQIPASEAVLARLLPDDFLPRYEPFKDSPWKGVQIENGIARLTRPAAPWVKIGLEADVLAIPVGQRLFVIHAPAAMNGASGYDRCRRAQVFSDPDESAYRPKALPPYIELEFTSPLKQLTAGESVSLSLTWELLPLSADATGTEKIIAAYAS